MTTSKLLFRFGFLIETDAGSQLPEISQNWRMEEVYGVRVLIHFEQLFRIYKTGRGWAIEIGMCFAIGDRTVDQIVSDLINDPEDCSPLDDLSGRFCLVVCNGSDPVVYNDPFGSQTLFYTLRKTSCIASHAELLARYVDADRMEDVRILLTTDGFKHLTVKYLPGNLSVYEDVFGLIPNHRYRLGTGLQERYWPRSVVPKGVTLSDFELRCSVYFRSLALALKGKETFLGITGGIDTRVVCAGLTRESHPFRGMTWLGNYFKANEQPIVDELISRMGIRHDFVEVPGPDDEVARISGRNSGNFRGRSRLTSAIASGIQYGENAIFVRGYGGEIIRGFYNLLRDPLTSFSPFEFQRIYAFKSRYAGPDPEFERITLAAFHDFYSRGSYEDLMVRFDHDVNDLFYWEQRMGMWAAAMHNEMDAAMYSITGLNDRRLFELAFALQPSKRLTKKLFSSLVTKYDRRLDGVSIQ